MNSCQRCGQTLQMYATVCPRCGAPVAQSPDRAQAAWQPPGSSPQPPTGQPPFGQPPFGQPSYGAQPPQFSAGDLISEDNLPDWLRGQVPDGRGAEQQAPARPQPWPGSQQGAPGWGAPADQPPQRPLSMEQTVRQPAVNMPFGQQPSTPIAPQAPQPQPFAAPSGPQGYGQPGYGSMPAPPVNPPYANPQGYAAPGPAYPPPGYPQQVAPGWQPGYPPPTTPGQVPPQEWQPGYPPAVTPGQAAPQADAFPSIDQAGAYGAVPRDVGMAAQGLVDQSALPPWLAGATPLQRTPAQPRGVSLGMQARSLIDEQALPQWLRQHTDEQQRPSVAEWLGASAVEEPLPSWVATSYPDVAAARAAQAQGTMGQAGAQPVAYNGALTPGQQPGAAWGPYTAPAAPVAPDDPALPDWLRAQAAGNPSGGGAPQQDVRHALNEAAGTAGVEYSTWGEQQSGAPTFAQFEQSQGQPIPFGGWGNVPSNQTLSTDERQIAYNSGVDASPTVRTPNAPAEWDASAGWSAPAGQDAPAEWDAPAGRDVSAEWDGSAGWDAPTGWDAPAEWNTPAGRDVSADPGYARADQSWGDSPDRPGDDIRQGGPRGRPLSPEEMPPWLRGRPEKGPDFSAAGGAPRMDNRSRSPFPERDEMTASQQGGAQDYWRDQSSRGASRGGWSDQRGHDDGSDRARRSYDEWEIPDNTRGAPDQWSGRAGRDAYGDWDGPQSGRDGWGEPSYQDEPPAYNRGGYQPRGGFDRADYDDYDDHLDDDAQPKKHRGWLGFLRRGE